MTAARTRTAATAGLLAATLGIAAACWIVALRQMDGMDMGAATDLGSFGFFAATWASMMAAMMLPGAVPAVVRWVGATGRLRGAALFPLSYLAVWTVVGVAVFALYRPHGALVAGALTIAAGAYELTALKRACRARCREHVRTGFEFGLYCIGSSAGLMVMLLALGAMSVTWMAVAAALVLAQKVIPPAPAIDIPVALAIAGLGIVVTL